MANRSSADARERPAADRLREALAALSADHVGTPTGSALCEMASVSRTALYRYHPDILRQLHALQRQRRRVPSSDQQAMQNLRKENLSLHRQLEQLAALVDHYFSAWQEASSLLKRRERELSEQRKGTKVKVVPMRA